MNLYILMERGVIMDNFKEMLENSKVDFSDLEEIEEMIAPACGCGCNDKGMGC